MVISKPIRSNKVLLSNHVDAPEASLRDKILLWTNNKTDFLTRDIHKEFRTYNRKTIERVLNSLTLNEVLKSEKCRCGCSNIYSRI